MATKKSKKLGFDPLSWLNDEKNSITKKESHDNINSYVSKKSKNNNHPLGFDAEIITSSFLAMSPLQAELASVFYQKLFYSHPELKQLFSNTTNKKQQRKMIQALQFVVDNINNVDILINEISELGKRHQKYNSVVEHYPIVRDILLSSMQEIIGEAWTSEVYQSWYKVLTVVNNTMIAAYEKTPVVENNNHPLGIDIKALKNSFDLLEPQGAVLIKRFYEELFIRYPTVVPLFKKTDENWQQKKFFSALKFVIQHLHEPKILSDALTELGARHQAYGAIPAHYDAVALTLLDVMQEFSGSAWNEHLQSAWTQALNVIAKVMTDAYNSTEVKKMATNITDMGSKLDEEQLAELVRMRSAVGGAMQAMMMIDRDFNITYANQATIDMLSKHELIIASVFPGFKANAVMGICIDQFHKNPSHQRQLLSNPKNLPYTTNIEVGSLKFKLNVTAMVDNDGAYIGNTLEWADITESLKKEDQAIKLQGAMEGSMQANIMVDRDLVITYANQATMDLLTKHQRALAAVFPGFEPKNLLGTCIDIFHKDPAMQRRLLSDPANLPHKADINIGDLKFSLNVTAITDSQGNYVGNSLEWSDVTELRERESNVARLQGTVDGAMTAMMMVDRDFIVTYANQSTMDLLSKHEAKLASVYPGFKANALIGTCIDSFHKNPAHQRQLLDDPNNLPYQTDIEISDLKFSLNVTAIKDAGGNYVGNALEWADVTEQRLKDHEVARLQSAVDGAEANLMICDADLIITYANPSVISMMANRAEKLRTMFPGFDANNLVGQCIDQFHKNPAHQRRLLADVSSLPASAEIKLGDIEFNVNATAITDHLGNLMGNMVEWRDITEQKDAERQIQGLIDAAVKGDLDARINAEQYVGFMKGLGESINELMEAVVVPLREGKKVVQALAEGDLTETMQGQFDGEFGELRDAMNSSMTNLLDMVNQIRDSAASIGSSSTEIAEGNANLSQRTEEQASSLEETASSMEQMTSTVSQNADNAKEANQLALAASKQAQSGGEVVSKAVDAMAEINSSSKKIADIIGVIDEIAFQTNLLALNAAVEAARAGEQGRGFAVVAGEVRNLAQRSAGAAKEIKGLINDSVEKVSDGSRLVDETGKTLEEIVNAVKKVSDIISEIAAASQEQSSGIEEVNRAITQMDEMTQQNAALVEEAAAAGESMNEQAGSLNELMNFFNVGEVEVQQPAVTARTKTPVVRNSKVATVTRKRPVRKNEGDEWEDF